MSGAAEGCSPALTIVVPVSVVVSVKSFATLIRNRSPLATVMSGLNAVDGREVYLVSGYDGTREGRFLTLLPSKDGTEKCQHFFRLQIHLHLHSWEAIRSDTAVCN